MPRVGGIHIFLFVANYISSTFRWCVRNGVTTEQHIYTNEAVDTELQIQIDVQSLSQTQDQKSHESSPQIPREMQNVALAESLDSEASTSGLSQNGARADVEITSQVVQSSSSQNRAQEEGMQTRQRAVALWATEISATGVTAVLAGFIGNHSTSSIHKLFFKASMISLCVSFAAGCCMLVINILRPNMRCLAVVVKILVIAAIGSMSLAVGFGVTFYLRKG